MKVSRDVVWMLTKKNSAHLVRPKGSKSRLEAFSKDPLNTTGLHNQSSSGTDRHSVGLGAEKGISKSNKSFRKVFVLRVNHKPYHKTQKVAKNTYGAARGAFSQQSIKKGAAHAAKTIQGLTFANDRLKRVLLRRLG